MAVRLPNASLDPRRRQAGAIVLSHKPLLHDSPGNIYRHNPIGLEQIGLLICLDHELVNDYVIGLGYPIKRLQAETRL